MKAACITALNEAESITYLVEQLAKDGFAVYVVDDGSWDNTGRLAVEAGATWVVHHDSPHGIASSLLEAWQAAYDDRADLVVQLDAGFSHDPKDAPGMARVIENGYDMVIGTRFWYKREGYIGGTRWRRAASVLATHMCNIAQPGAHYSDWTSGYRAFSGKAIKELLRLSYLSQMHGFQIEVLAHAGAMGLRITEYPIVYRAGHSSFRFSTAIESLNAWSHVLNHIGAKR